MTPRPRKRSPATLIAAAIPLGFGPAAKLLVLAAAARERGLRLVFVGSGTSLELAARHENVLHDVVPAKTPQQISRALWQSSAGLLSVMDRTFAPHAAERNLPLLVVDSLLWMRDELPAAWRSAQRLWAQNFVGLHDWPGLGARGLTVVGPILEAYAEPQQPPRGGLLIHLGGCASSKGGYARFVIENVLASPLARPFAGRIKILAGERCANELMATCAGLASCLSASHDAALAHLDQAEVVLTAPGLTMTLECFQRGKPTFFLPPQNYSQWCILRSLRRLGLAPAALHWEDLPGVLPLAERLPEEVRNPLVRAALARGTASAAAAAAVQRGCLELSGLDWAELACRQRAFFSSLGTSGVPRIVEELDAFVRPMTTPMTVRLTPSRSRRRLPARPPSPRAPG